MRLVKLERAAVSSTVMVAVVGPGDGDAGLWGSVLCST